MIRILIALIFCGCASSGSTDKNAFKSPWPIENQNWYQHMDQEISHVQWPELKESTCKRMGTKVCVAQGFSDRNTGGVA